MSEWGSANYMVSSRLDRPASTQTAMAQKQKQRDDLLLAVQMYQEAGGTITKVPYGVSKEQQLIKMRMGELELITAKQLADRWKLRGGTLPTVLSKYDTLMFIMLDGQKAFWIKDIERIEQMKDFAMKGKKTL
jgi:hypothetical protein